MGALAGPVVFVCFTALGTVICQGPTAADEPNRSELALLAAWVSLTFGPPIGLIGGAAWAFERSRRVNQPKPPAPPTAPAQPPSP